MFTVENPPEWLKGLPEAAIRAGLSAYCAVFSGTKDEAQAKRASMAAVKAGFERGPDGAWRERSDISSVRRGVLRFRAAQADTSGLMWEAVIIAPGLSLSMPRFYWSEEVLAKAAALFQGVDVNAYELTTDFYGHLSIPNVSDLEDVKRYLTARKAGWVEKAWFEAGVGVKGLIRFLPEQAWLPETIRQGIEAGNPNVLGLSIDSRVRGVEVVVDDWTVVWVTEILGASSVDVVTRPAAGGKFLRAVAGLGKEEGRMEKEKLLALIKEKRPDLLKGKDAAALSEDELLALARQCMEPAPDPGTRAAQATGGLTPDEIAAQIKSAVEAVEQRAACSRMLDAELLEAKLPEMAAQFVRDEFAGQVFEAEKLTATIKRQKDYLATMAATTGNGGSTSPWGDQSRASGGLGMRDKVQIASDKLFGLTGDDITGLAALRRLDGKPVFEGLRVAQDYEGVPAPAGIAELYVLLTGDAEVNGGFHPARLSQDIRAAQDLNSATFAFALGNTLARRLVKDYREATYGEELLISIRKPVKDFRQQEAVMIGYFGDLDDVDPETEDYQEISGVTDEESTYAVGQKGNLLTITRKVIKNDDLSVIQRKVTRLGRSARRTHAKYVWGKFVNNATCSDGTAWFTVGHGNLGTTALSLATALVAYKALAGMTEKDSGEVIGLLDNDDVKPVLIYPPSLMETAESIVNDEAYYTGNDLTTKTRNSLRGKITGRQISRLSDANDWGLLMPSSEVDMVEMGYLDGRQEPEMFVADQPTSEQVFVADKVRYKIRHEYAGAVIDYRGGYKAVVA